MRKTPLLIILALVSTMLVACNTVKGAGQDVQKAGSAIEKAADQNK